MPENPLELMIDRYLFWIPYNRIHLSELVILANCLVRLINVVAYNYLVGLMDGVAYNCVWGFDQCMNVSVYGLCLSVHR